MATRGIRNNNAGNIRVGKDQWEGAVGDDGEFVTFDAPESGIRALGRNLLSYGRQGFDSLDKIINRWAPPNENNTQAYLESVAAATGFKPDQALNLNDPDTLASVAKAIMVHENGQANYGYTDEQLKTGISRALAGGGITPKSEPLGADVFKALTEGVVQKPAISVGQGLPTTGGLNIEGQQPEAPNESFSETYYKEHGETISDTEGRSTWFGFGDATKGEVQNSTLGVAIRAGQQEDGLDVIGDVFNPTRWNQHQWSRDELDQIRKAGVRPDYYGAITGGSPQNLQTLINLALENQKNDDDKYKAGFGAQMAAGVIGAGADPLSYIPIAGLARDAKLVSKVFTTAAQTGAISGGSELIRSRVAGGQDHVAEAIVGGAAFGGGMSLLAEGLGRAIGSRAPNEFHPPAIRLEARETARNAGTQDLSRRPIDAGEETSEHLGVKFADVPNEAGSVRLEDGSILIGENPLNPKSQKLMDELEPERAARGVNLGGITEIGLKVLRSDSPEVRALGSDLVRSPTGMESGATGKIGTTSADVFERLRAVDHRFYNDLDDSVREALKDPYFQTNFWKDNKAHREDVYQRVALAIEDPSGFTKADLTAGELKVFDLLKNHFDSKREMMENPAMFGRMDAKNIFPNSRHVGTYVPNVYNSQAKQMYIQTLGSPEALQEAISKSWLTSYSSRPEVKTRVDEMVHEQSPDLKSSIQKREQAVVDVENTKSQKAYEQDLKSYQTEADAVAKRNEAKTKAYESELAAAKADYDKAVAEAGPLETRGTARLHGTSNELKNGLDDAYSLEGDSRNIYGHGFYTTDAADIATGYMRKGKGDSPTLYEVAEQGQPNLYKMSEPMDDEVRAIVKRELGEDYTSNSSLQEAFDDFRQNSRDEGLSRYDVQDAFNSIRDSLEAKGYQGFEHIGGDKTGSKPHTVKIYWKPSETIKIAKAEEGKYVKSAPTAPRDVTPPVLEEVSRAEPTAPTPRQLDQASVDSMIDAEVQKVVQKYANDKAYGISHSDNFSQSSVMEDNINGLVGLENNAFLEARNLFDSDMSIHLPTGETFSVNNLREWNMDKIVPAYNRRVNGDISIMAGTGKTTKELKDVVNTMMDNAGDNGKLKGEVAALRDTLKILTGRARRDGQDDAAMSTVLRTMTDLSFFAKNAYMGVQNLTEIGGMLARGNVRAMMHGIPVFRDLAFRNKKMGAKEIKELHGVIFGKEIDDSIRPTKQDVIDRLRAYSSMGQYSSSALGGLKYYTGELAVRSPWTKVLNETTNYLLDAGRQGFLSDIVEHSLTGSKRRFDDRWLKSAGINDAQWKGIKDVIKENVTQGPDGSFKITDKKAFSQDPRVMDLWRLGDTIADETLLRPHKLSNMDSKAYGPLAKLVLQFKSFVLKSVNGRFMRSFYNASKNHRAIDQALSLVMSMGLAGSYYMAQAHLKASAMQDGADRKYLKQALDPAMIGYAALSRSSVLGGPLGVANILGGIAGFQDTRMLRSSILPKDPESKPERAITYGAATSDPVMGVVGNILEQVPAFGYAANVGASAYNLKGYLKSDTRVNENDYMTGMYNTMRELVPNDPLTQRLMLGIFEQEGIHVKQ